MKQDDEDIPEEEQDGFTMGEIQPSSNFSNPVYETMFQQVIIQIATKSDESRKSSKRYIKNKLAVLLQCHLAVSFYIQAIKINTNR